MLKIKKQINILYITSVFWNLSITGAWVAILSARGFSLVEIGLAETIFHITSLIFEIPSGVLADVIGRKKMLLISNFFSIISCLVMALTGNFAGVCVSFVFTAMSWNFASGSGDALAYDSLKTVNEEEKYIRYSSNQMIIYRITTAVSTLCAGLALVLGYRIAYLLSVVNHVIAMIFLFGLTEVEHRDTEDADTANRSGRVAENPAAPAHPGTGALCGFLQDVRSCFRESFRFLFDNKKATALMFLNSFVGAFDTLLLFFLQSKLRDAGLQDRWLGVALFLMELGGVLGAKLVLKVPQWKYAAIFAITTLGVLTGIALEHTGITWVMVAGGFLSAVSDDALQIRTDAKLQDMFPSAQRATLISITSFVFSVVMIVLSPLAGWFFSVW